ncbi:hypothetical protein GALMADRAFT_148535 [Galerina marginata CBS 339.88]|uniref:Uncharacterized protein n=1 Tax=Galerina marginata (strain CBS 339.88) TaxID=685588 RepID=A0A067SFT9_GALM3|nr:hypothetical protein GALMADRAFT_148535 [Galerina marginata CBS 339.88]
MPQHIFCAAYEDPASLVPPPKSMNPFPRRLDAPETKPATPAASPICVCRRDIDLKADQLPSSTSSGKTMVGDCRNNPAPFSLYTRTCDLRHRRLTACSAGATVKSTGRSEAFRMPHVKLETLTFNVNVQSPALPTCPAPPGLPIFHHH